MLADPSVVGTSYTNTTVTTAAGTKTLTDVTIPSGATTALIGVCGWGSAEVIDTVSLDGQAATFVNGFSTAGNADESRVFVVTGFSTGSSKTLSFNVTNGAWTGGIPVGIVFLQGENTASPVSDSDIASANSSGGTATTPTLTIPANSLVVSFVCADASTSPTYGSGQTQVVAPFSGMSGADPRLSVSTEALSSDDTQAATADYPSIVGVVIAAGATATLEQEGFRWGVDDGSESAHTWEAAQDTSITIAASQSRLLRLLVNATDDPASIAYTLRYQKNGSGGYVAVPVGSTTSFGIPTWVSAGTPASGTGAVTAPMPSSFAAGDLLVMVVETANEAVASPPSGWTEVSASPQGTGTAAGTTSVRLTVYAKIASGSETAVSIGDAGNHTLVNTFALRGTHQTLGTALNVVAGDVDASGSTSVTFPGGTTTADNALIVQIVANATDTATAQGSGWANAGLGSVTEQLDFSTASGNGGGITVVTGTLATAGSIGSTTGTLATSSVQGRITLAVIPPATVNNEVYVTASSNIASGGEATTARLTAPSGKSTSDFVTGRRWDDENGTDTIDITTDDYSETEWNVALSSAPSASDYFDVRVYAGSSALDTYSVTPRWTIPSGGSTKSALIIQELSH